MRFVNKDLAKTLQELGYEGVFSLMYFEVPAPRLDDAAYFLREKYGFSIRINYSQAYEDWFFDILNLRNGEYIDSDEYFAEWNDALEGAISQTIKIIKEKQL